MGIPNETVAEHEVDEKTRREREELANASSRSRSNKASRTAFPAPIRSMSPSRPPAWRTKGKH